MMKIVWASLSTFGLEINVSNVGKIRRRKKYRKIRLQGSPQIIQTASRNGSFFAIPLIWALLA